VTEPQDDDLDDGLGLEKFAFPSANLFRYDGWHLPRKQFIRHSQWSEPLRALMAERADVGGPLRYLGLPGADLLDIRHLHERLCLPDGRVITFLGFDRSAHPNSAENFAVNAAYADMLRSPLVEDSNILPDDLYLLIDEASIAFQEMKRRAPFDVINLDFCEGVFGADINAQSCVYPLLMRLFSVQRTNDPWLLLITSRVSADAFASTTLQRLLAMLQSNVTDCEGFASACSEVLPTELPMDESTARGLPANVFFSLVSLMAGKWLVRAAAAANCKLKVVSAAGYKVHGGAQAMDMLSLSIRVEPQYVLSADGTGLVGGENDECAQALRMVPRMARPESIDEYLDQNETSSRRATAESRTPDMLS